jgi:hypothetical protein
MTEKRDAARKKSFLRGLVYFGNSPSATDCLVRDISETGARLKFSSPPASTDNLDLHIPVKGSTFHATVSWRNGDEIGVSFVTSAVADASPASDGELAARVARLEAEIAALKQLIKRLQKNTDAITDAA